MDMTATATERATGMKAVVRDKYGAPDVLGLQEVAKPELEDDGSFAEYVCVRMGVARKPSNLTFEEAAAVPVAALTALQGLRDHGQLQAGHARRRSRDRLHRGGLRPQRPALRRNPGCCGQQVMVAVQARTESARDTCHCRRTNV